MSEAVVTPSERDAVIGNMCWTCRWSGFNMAPTHYMTKQGTAQCRRFPPVPGKHGEWPTIILYDGCGEWKDHTA